MGTLLDLASLVVVPSGYKEDKIYSVVPTDGSGDLDFTRASNATRVNSAGLIEKVRTNFKIQSEALTTAAGGLSFTDITTITANTTDTLDPFGTNKAEKFDGTIGQLADSYNTISTLVPNTSSIYAKAGTATSFDLRMSGAFSAAANAVFNLSNGTVTSSGGGELISSKIEFVGNGWYRCSISYNFTSVPTNRIALTANGNVYFFGWQLEATDFGATDYIPTTTTAVSVGMTANVPRLDYLNSSCPSLLLEPQRTNLLSYSEQFDNADWSKSAVTITQNDITSPDGYANADKMIESATTSGHYILQSPTLTAEAYTFSIFAKVGERNWFLFRQHTLGLNASFNLSTGTLGTVQSGLTASIENYGNGWYRCSVTFTGTAAANSFRLYVTTADNSTSSYLGDGTSGLYLYGGQCELGSYPTSYIPTLGTSVTRVADACFKTGISSLIGQTQGTIYGNFYVNPSGQESQSIWLRKASGGLYGDIIFILVNNAQQPRAEVGEGGSSQFSYTGSSISVGWHKFALAYKQNDFAFYIDGVQMATDNSGTVPTCDEMYLGYYPDGGIRQTSQKEAIIFPVRLTNSELASLTSL